MKKDYILFIDSGIGGLSTLSSAIKLINYNYIYFADNKNSPYGNHQKEEIITFMKDIISSVCKNYNVKIIVIACNTATASSLDELRAIFLDKIIIGTEPAVNLAVKSGYKNIFSLTTPLTKTLLRYKKLENKAKHISTVTYPNLASLIDDCFLMPTFQNSFEILKIAADISKLALNFDCIVLGCTHYVFLKPIIKQFSNKPLIDGNFGIASRMSSFVPSKNYTKKSNIKIILSKPEKSLEKKYIKILSQTLAK